MSMLDGYIPEGAVSPSAQSANCWPRSPTWRSSTRESTTTRGRGPLASVSPRLDSDRLGCPEDDPCRHMRGEPMVSRRSLGPPRVTFLSAVSDPFGVWGPAGTPNVV